MGAERCLWASSHPVPRGPCQGLGLSLVPTAKKKTARLQYTWASAVHRLVTYLLSPWVSLQHHGRGTLLLPKGKHHKCSTALHPPPEVTACPLSSLTRLLPPTTITTRNTFLIQCHPPKAPQDV